MASFKNPYHGINAHLNSLLQTPGTEHQPAMWSGFHSQHITNICEALNAQLPENYIAISEQSLQVRTLDAFEYRVKRPEPDVSIFQQTSRRTVPATAPSTLQPVWEADIVEVLEAEELMTAVVIREVSEQAVLGKPVTRIELLSPSNKPGSPDYPGYRIKRSEAIHAGIPLVEIDYLHEQPSPIRKLPTYPSDPKSYPYTIAISDPRPLWQEGHIGVYGVHVDDPLPIVPLLLADKEILEFDVDAVYQQTYERGRWGKLIDMTQTPERFETYSAEDRERIRRRMETVIPSP